MAYLNTEEIRQGLPTIKQSPKDKGTLEAIVIRPAVDQRESLTTCEITPEGGVPGDGWGKGYGAKLPDNRPNPDAQITMMNARAIHLIAQTKDRWALAGDNLYVDLDLSEDNLTAGQQLSLGTALLEATAKPHNGCNKFMDRFGLDALTFFNSPEGKHLHLRGIYVKVVQAGVITIGDRVKVI